MRTHAAAQWTSIVATTKYRRQRRRILCRFNLYRTQKRHQRRFNTAGKLAVCRRPTHRKTTPFAQKALSTVGIDTRRQLCRHLSAGQKRRTALARLLLNRARLWFLDEPLSALDVAGQQILAQILGAHLSGGGGAILATHQPVGIAATQTLRLCAP